MKTNQEKLSAKITRAEAAQYISAETNRPCSWRAIQS